MASPIDRLDALPSPRAAGVASTLKVYTSAVAATGKVTMAQIEAAGAFGRKTILKHIRAGILPAEKAIVNGKEMWLFEPEEVAAYLASAADLLERAVHHKANRPQRVTTPDGYLSLTAAAQKIGVSHWTLREHLVRMRIQTRQGRHAVKMIAEADMPLAHAYFERITRPQPRHSNGRMPAKGQIKGGPYFSDFSTLWLVLRAQPEIGARELADITGATLQTARRWVTGNRTPDSVNAGALIALFRERFRCRLSEDLLALTTEHRARFMRRTMGTRRERPEIKAQEHDYAQAHADERAARSAKYHAEHRGPINEVRRIRRAIDKKSGGEQT